MARQQAETTLASGGVILPGYRWVKLRYMRNVDRLARVAATIVMGTVVFLAAVQAQNPPQGPPGFPGFPLDLDARRRVSG